MKTERNILLAFILNLAFSIFEFVGGIFTGSVAIISDAIHDIGDATGIGVAFFLEKKSKKAPDEKHTFGYARYSVIGSTVTTLILLLSSVAVIYNAILRIITPKAINYDGMLIFALVGVAVNFVAALLTHEGDSLNQKAVNLHMLEDVLGWVVVLIGAAIMKFTNFYIIDPIMSVCVAIFILINAIKNLGDSVNIFLEKTPDDINISEIKEHLLHIDGVSDVHHIHVWTMDGYSNHATLHIVTEDNAQTIKKRVREELAEHGVSHATIELEQPNEHCYARECVPEARSHTPHCHHH